IPGLIEGAAEGAGIGDRFLGHIERCRVLIHLIDIEGADPDPVEAMRIVEGELEAYGEGLDGKPRLVALNKVDLADAELADAFAADLRKAGAEEVFPISGATGEGIDALLDAVIGHLPARTVTERPKGEVEEIDDDDATSWSPL
ncbi:MAG: GTPase ObgE, partial [Novosphingobium sp.]|nr:GTPase ObgE [Novosphingobium sp.]